MDHQEFISFAEQIFKEMLETLKRKNSDYTAGNKSAFANFNQSIDWGVEPFQGVMLRLGDKVQRLKAHCLQRKLEVCSESPEDSLRDIIGYCVIALGIMKD